MIASTSSRIFATVALTVALLLCLSVPLTTFTSAEGILDRFSPPLETNAFERNLVKEDVTISSFLTTHNQWARRNHVRNVVSESGPYTLGYVTPWNSHGYDVAKMFALKFTHIAPVWFQIKMGRMEHQEHGHHENEDVKRKQEELEKKKSKTFEIRVEGTHNVDKQWIRAVKESGSDHANKIRSAVVPRFIVEPTSIDDYIELAEKQSVQKRFIDAIQSTIEEYELDGAVLEMTHAWYAVSAKKFPPELRNKLNAFIMKLGAALHATKTRMRDEGDLDAAPVDVSTPKQLILVVRPYTKDSLYFQAFDFNAVHAYVDGFSLMTYDHNHRTAPGANAPIDWVRDSVKALVGPENLTKPNVMKKVMMGLAFYGYKYQLDTAHHAHQGAPAGAPPIVGHELVKLLQDAVEEESKVEWHAKTGEHSFHVLTKTDAQEYEIYFPTLYSIHKRIELANSLGTSVSIWEIGQGVDSFFDVL